MNNCSVDTSAIKLTQLSYGGGCGCKIAPAVLADLIAKTSLAAMPPELLVGTETADDAAIYQLNDEQAIIATTDFFMPIVDDPFDFGRIAATNALSDVYAMGGRPLFALAVVGMPLSKLPVETIRRILAGGESVCAAAGIPLAGGHSIDSAEPIYGLVGIGVVHPKRLKRNSGAQGGDVLVFGKPLGVGILSAALKKGVLSPEGYAEMVRWTTKLNAPGPRLAELAGVHAMTDVAGFGLAGHLLEMARGSGLTAVTEFNRIPLIEEAVRHARDGIVTGASARNWASYCLEFEIPEGMPEWQRHLLTDPQTSGGLLVACSADTLKSVQDAFAADGFQPAVIGRFENGPARLRVLTDSGSAK
jgi:selenide,water dikinase